MPRPFRGSLHVSALLLIMTVGLLESPAGRAADAAKPSGDRLALVGTWKIVSFKDDGIERVERLGGVAPGAGKVEATKFPKIVFTADECWVLHADGKRDLLPGRTDCAFKSCTLDEKASPKAVDLVGFRGAKGDQLHTYHGIYELDGKKLRICWNEGGDARPTKFESDKDMDLFVCERVSDQPEKPKE
jgi:uncharacterized protein (TIGR03067 family)